MPGHAPSSMLPPGDRSIHLAEIEAALERTLPTPPACPPIVAEAMRYAVHAGGKRFRPLLTLAAAEAVASARGGDESLRASARRDALPMACAVELVHAQSLVHDDLPAMDDDVLRRGLPTVHVRFGEGLALLVGDALLAEAFGVLARAACAAPDVRRTERTVRALLVLGEAVGASGMVGGQAIDLAVTGTGHTPGTSSSMDLDQLTDMHARKTGGLIRAAAVGGALLAGGDDAQADALGRFAASIGLAYQILDDVDDVNGTTATLGKTVGKDADARKVTFAGLLGCERALGRARVAIADAEAGLAGAGLATPALTALARRLIRHTA